MTIWRRIHRVPGGHTLFVEDGVPYDRRAIAIADESGTTPDRTDDGVLFLDFDEARPMVVSCRDARVPLRRPDGEKTYTIMPLRAVAYLRREFNMPMRVTQELSRLLDAIGAVW